MDNSILDVAHQNWLLSLVGLNNLTVQERTDAIVMLFHPTITRRATDALVAAARPGVGYAHDDYMNVVQAAKVAVVSALYRFDPEKGSLLNYLLSVIDGAIRGMVYDGGLNASLEDLPEDLPQLAEDWRENTELRIVIEAALQKLPFKWARVIWLRYLEGYTQQETAKYMQWSQQHVSRIERAALTCLQNIMGTDPRER